MVYPDTRGDGEHYLACFELDSGRPVWKTRIAGEVITAPILANQEVFFTTLDGTLHCCGQEDGELLWRESVCATSSPTVMPGQCYFSQRKAVQSTARSENVQQTEHCARRETSRQGRTLAYKQTSRQADYLDHTKRESRSPQYAAYAAHDAGVGFAASKGTQRCTRPCTI